MIVSYNKGKYRVSFELSDNLLTIKTGINTGRYYDMSKGLITIRVEDIMGIVHVKGSNILVIQMYNSMEYKFNYSPAFMEVPPVEEIEELVQELTNKIGVLGF